MVNEDTRKAIEDIVNLLFDKLKVRLLGRFFRGPKIVFEMVGEELDPLLTLEGLYRHALTISAGANLKPSVKTMRSLSEITDNYLEAEKLKTINRVVAAVDQGANDDEIDKLLGEVFESAEPSVSKIVNTETRNYQANAEREGILKVSASVGEDDPTVLKYGSLDEKTCQCCLKLWHSKDNPRIPKVYKLSQLQDGYCDHKDPKPTILATHPHCYDDQTEVLTKRGWILFKDVVDNDIFLSVNPDSGESDWVKHIGLLALPYSGPMVHITNKRTNLMTTPNHKHVFRNRKGELKLSDFSDCCQDDAVGATIPAWKGIRPQIKFDGKDYDTVLFAEFLGYYLSEGCVTKSPKHKVGRIEICQAKHNDKMYECVTKIFGTGIYNKHMKIIVPGAKRPELVEFLRSFGKSHEKFVPEFIKNSDSEIIRVFLDAYRLGDGSTRQPKKFATNPELTYSTSSPQMAADIGELILKMGKKPSYYNSGRKTAAHRNGTYTAKRDQWLIRENRLPFSLISNCSVTYPEYDGMIYDVELEKWHTLFVRRCGKVALSGNCRHHLSMVPAGFGFNENGRIEFKEFDYDVYAARKDVQ